MIDVFLFIPLLQPNTRQNSAAIELMNFIWSHICIIMVKTSNVFYLHLLWHESLFQVVTKCANNYCFFKNMFSLQTLTNRRHTRKVGPGMSSGGTWDPGPWTPKCVGGTWDSQSGTWDLKYVSKTQDFQFSIVLIVYSTLNTLDSTCYKTLHLSVHKINLFHREYTEATIMMCYKFQKLEAVT